MPRSIHGLQVQAEAKRKWFSRHPEYHRAYYLAHPEKWRLSSRKQWMKLKVEVYSHYSPTGKPQCSDPYHRHLPNDPFAKDIRVLSIDHINSNGAEERKRLFKGNYGCGGYQFYLWLRKQGYPEGYQTLCRNCQAIKVIVNKENAQV